MSEIREMVLEFLDDDEEVMFFDSPSYDEAIIGLSENNKVVYSYDGMIDCLMKKENMSAEEAMEFIDYNTACFSEKENYPIIVRLF